MFVFHLFFVLLQNAMPLSSAIFKSEHKNPVPQCPPRLYVQTINAVLWSRMPNTFLKVETSRVNERHGWVVQCVEPLQMLAVHIPEENRYVFRDLKGIIKTQVNTYLPRILYGRC